MRLLHDLLVQQGHGDHLAVFGAALLQQPAGLLFLPLQVIDEGAVVAVVVTREFGSVRGGAALFPVKQSIRNVERNVVCI